MITRLVYFCLYLPVSLSFPSPFQSEYYRIRMRALLWPVLWQRQSFPQSSRSHRWCGQVSSLANAHSSVCSRYTNGTRSPGSCHRSGENRYHCFFLLFQSLCGLILCGRCVNTRLVLAENEIVVFPELFIDVFGKFMDHCTLRVAILV